ncbi:MAG TPA: head-tail adaptor protein [Terricaulis sp.]|nr:head-tail adaptor protein [Terricaulis sp.]
MRARVRLESPARAADDLGGASLAWANEGDVWAAIEAAGVGGAAAFDAAPSISAYRFTIHRRDDLRAGWRVVWGDRVFRIVGVRDEGAARIILNCEEERL